MALTIDLYPYQNDAVELGLELGFGLIAYEMGLGKTLVAITLVEELLTKPDINFALIVVPSNLRYQWAQSIAEFTDVDTKQIKIQGETFTIPTDEWCVVVDGPLKKRREQYQYIDEHWPNFAIISYEQARDDYRIVRELGAECVIIDEAGYIKGFSAQRSKKVKALGRKAEYTYALTGTPIENRPEELYSIMDFVDPGFLGSYRSFDAKYIVRDYYGRVKRYRNLDVLHNKLLKVMSRKTRLDEDVAPYLPAVSYKDEPVILPPKTQALYNKIAGVLTQELATATTTGDFDLAAYYAGDGDSDMSEMGKIMSKLLALQMLCDDWRLIADSAQKYNQGGGAGSKYAAELAASGALADLEPSAKLASLVEDVTDILDQNPANKVIIFSFFKPMVDWIQQSLPYDSVIYNGDMSLGKKAAARNKFQTDPNCRLFIATDAGAYGVDLPQANYLINYDEVDSAGKMDQRNARHVRAGSKHSNVFVLSYVVDGSIEERRHQRLALKRLVATASVDGHGADNGTIENDVQGLGEFLSTNVVEDPASV